MSSVPPPRVVEKPRWRVRSTGGASPSRSTKETLAYRIIREDKETCQLILAALEERIRSLVEARDRSTPPNNEEHLEASFGSMAQEHVLYKIYRRFGGTEPEDELIPFPEIR